MTHGNVSKRIGWALASTEDFDGAAPCCAALCRVVKTPPQRTPRGPQDVPNELKEGSNTFQMSSNNNRKQDTPRYVQDTLKIRPRYASPEAPRYARYLRHPSQTALPDTLSTRKSRYAQIRPDTLPDTPPPARGARSLDRVSVGSTDPQKTPQENPKRPRTQGSQMRLCRRRRRRRHRDVVVVVALSSIPRSCKRGLYRPPRDPPREPQETPHARL